MQNYIVDPTACVVKRPFPGVELTIMESPQMTMSIVDMQPHSVIPEHSHPHEQIGLMLEGEATFVIAGETRRVTQGQMWRLPGNVPHEVSTGELPMKAVDIFYPVRDDLR